MVSRGRVLTDGGPIVEPPKPPRRPPTDRRTPPLNPPPYRPLPRTKTQTSTRREAYQDSGAGGTYGRPVTTVTRKRTINAYTGKVIGSKVKTETQVYKSGKYVKK